MREDTEKLRTELKKIADGLKHYESGQMVMPMRDILAVFQCSLLIDIRDALPRPRRSPAASAASGEAETPAEWTCPNARCGTLNFAGFCTECGEPKPVPAAPAEEETK